MGRASDQRINAVPHRLIQHERANQVERNKESILKSGIDPDLKRLRRLQAIKSSQEKKFIKAVESIEYYWESVFAAIADKEKELAEVR